MSRSLASRILDVLHGSDEPILASEIAAKLGEEARDVSTELAKLYIAGRVLRFGERGTGSTGSRRAWALPRSLHIVPPPSNVIPLRPVPTAPLRMLPVVRRYDCVHEPECSFAAAKKWPEAEGMTCPTPCEAYAKAPRRPVPHPSNWMGGEG